METTETAAEEQRAARNAPEALERLRAALRDAGIRLPSLRLDPVSAVRDDRFALVDLGRCNFVVASQLADALWGRRGLEEPGEVSAADPLRERVRSLNRGARLSDVVGGDGGLACVVGAGVGVGADVGEGEFDGSAASESEQVTSGVVGESRCS